jgi:hypothetical protein
MNKFVKNFLLPLYAQNNGTLNDKAIMHIMKYMKVGEPYSAMPMIRIL